MRIVRDGFVWLVVTDKARDVYASGLFDLYALYEDGSESLVGSQEDLEVCLEWGLDIGIEVGHQVDVLEVMYEYMGHNGHKLREMYESIPLKDNMFNYEQFIVAQFSNLIDGHN
jgi:hypothetical protein